MPRIEQTRKACPSCDGPLELHIELEQKGDGSRQAEVMRTAKVVRLLVCPSCGFRREEEAADRG